MTELMEVFREALIALIPALERARIAWRSPEAYDDWDAIAETLFEQIVVNSIRHGLAEDYQEVRLNRWGLKIGLDWIEVVPQGGAAGHRLAVVAFETRQAPFDMILAEVLDETDVPLQEDAVEIPFEGARFYFHWRSGREGGQVIEDLVVQL
ncbi:hypothetical protein E5F05_10330 [Deinococcus metallilatus]|uniref:Uncharacterized protein n=1 Tax=Deinococcus metallilatus TaxID=1211322 RepID=A0AAJ5F3A0_9DEIO|nr:hypothetical protein [Deinococcus metallilatus]MBB5295862.1 hypothetical protein [Deinococcus metallilatus]QBY08297.1 hypothetical protein E5F05_10330 [Deinococcus metallilatus]RXJ12028.1 hypothetical protein ERJ73_09140 [Deinococcus metallilatus]TLK25740.1 hypothetical protein FCS05_11840 [Deinococcus metallilatus]